MAKIVINSTGSLGDLNPFALLGVELSRRGHSVVFATISAYQSRLESLGLTFRATRPDLNPEDVELTRKIMDPKTGAQLLMREIYLPNLGINYQDVADAAQGADLLISGSLAAVCYLVHHRLQVPWISVTLQPSLFTSVYEFPVMPILPQLRHWPFRLPFFGRLLKALFRWVLDRECREWAALCRQLNVPVQNLMLDAQFSPQLQLAAYSPHFGGRQPDWPDCRQHVGFIQPPLRGQMLSEETREFLSAGDAPWIFTLGSTAVKIGDEFFERAIEMAQQTGERTLLVCGPRADRLRTQTQHLKHICCVSQEPYSALFSQGRAVIHQGGIGTTGEVLRAGVPMVVVPFGVDQYDTAAHIEKLGCGSWTAMDTLTLSRLKRCLRHATQPDVVARARVLGEKIRVENGVTAAADRVENFLGVRRGSS